MACACKSKASAPRIVTKRPSQLSNGRVRSGNGKVIRRSI